MNEMNNNRFDEIKKILEEPAVPERLSPESVKKALDERQQNKKRSSIRLSSALRWGAGIAACSVLIASGGYAAKQLAEYSDGSGMYSGSYVVSSADYSDVYAYMKECNRSRKENSVIYFGMDAFDGEVADEAIAEEAATSAAGYDSSNTYTSDVRLGSADDSYESTSEISEVYNQETGVLEADIVQTDGRFIYSARSLDTRFIINVAETDGNIFSDSYTINLKDYLPETVITGDINAMYLKEGRLIVVFNAYEKILESAIMDRCTYVMTFAAGEDFSLLGLYSQDGMYNDVRLMEDGILYLITNYGWTERYLVDEKYEDCLPTYYFGEKEYIAEPEDIIIPEPAENEGIKFDLSSSFTNIGSLNVLSDTPDESVDFKSIAGFTGDMYCSLSNIYLAAESYMQSDLVFGDYSYINNSSTEFTRLSISEGIITPEASINVPGRIKDQFSMSEYDGYFRAAVTRDNYSYVNESGNNAVITDNAVYVFDLDMNQIGEIGGFGVSENVKSVSFQGDLVYVVTFRETDPLYAIDLSDPCTPVILDEYKITGYSSYMQQWDEGLLLGFGLDADETGTRLGVKLVMFDNSDPENLTECGIAPIHPLDVVFEDDVITEYSSVSSEAMDERKALLISPDRNLIAVPFTCGIQYEVTKMYDNYYGYALYSYSDGCFTQNAVIYGDSQLSRAVYINDTLYLIGSEEMIAVDLVTMCETDRVYF